MGEAKRRAGQKAAASIVDPRPLFDELGIDHSKPGFYDDVAFQSQEHLNPSFLESYARFVRTLPLSDEYLERSRRLIPAIAGALQVEMAARDRRRACMDAGLALTRMLEAAGVWNTVIRGAFSVELVGKPTTCRYFHAIGPLDEGAGVHGHTWIYAPPFDVVDVTAKLQPWDPPALEAAIPEIVLIEGRTRVPATPELVIDHDWLVGAALSGQKVDMKKVLGPQRLLFIRDFPGSTTTVNGAQLTYLPTAVTAPIEPLEEVGFGEEGLQAGKLWVEKIRPSIKDLL